MHQAPITDNPNPQETPLTHYYNTSPNYNGFGCYLEKEVLEKYKLDIGWLSVTLEVSLLYAKMIISNKVRIDQDMAQRLASYFCNETSYWLKLQEKSNQTKVI